MLSKSVDLKKFLLDLQGHPKIFISLCTNNRTLGEILHQIQAQINTEDTSFINVRRSAIWVDTCR